MTRGRSFNRIERLVQGVVVLCLLGLTAIAAFAPFREGVLPFLPDDAFYYLEIARRAGSGEGSTFDGITKTNGYHPLWTLMLMPLAGLMNRSREAGARAAMLIGVALMAGAFYFLLRIARQLQRSTAALAILVPAAILCFSSNYGMESPLVLFLFAALFWWESKLPRQMLGVWTGVMLGLVAGLLMLARLDMVVYVAVMNAVLLYNAIRRRGGRTWHECLFPLVACWVAHAALVAPYFLFNLAFFGHPIPISAMLKLARRSGHPLAWLTASWGAPPGVAGTILGVVALVLRRRQRTSPFWLTSVLGNLAYMITIIFKAGREVYHWYFALPTFLSGIFAAVIAAEAHRRRWMRISASYALWGVIAALLITASTTRRYLTKGNANKQARYDMAVWIAHCSPTSSVFAATDCGILAYFSHRSVINLDGLTADVELQEAMRDHRLPDHLLALGLNSMVTLSNHGPVPSADGTAVAYIHTYAGLYGPAQTLEATIKHVPTPDCDKRFLLWKLYSLREVRRETPITSWVRP